MCVAIIGAGGYWAPLGASLALARQDVHALSDRAIELCRCVNTVDSARPITEGGVTGRPRRGSGSGALSRLAPDAGAFQGDGGAVEVRGERITTATACM
jgi:hypothetical protein